MKAIERVDHYQIKKQWDLVNQSFRIFQVSDNPKVRAACNLIACHFQGEKWCTKNGHTWIPLDDLDFQIVANEEQRLKDKGAI